MNRIFHHLGYEIRKIPNGFTFNPNLNWLKEYGIKTIIDIGANEGQFARYINLLFPDSTIYSFEPIKKCYEKLVELRREIEGLIPLNYALGDSNSVVDFFVNNFTPSSSFLKMEEEHIKNFPDTKDTKLEKIETKTLDNISIDLKINKEVLVKIDVQGFEDKVIKGGEKFFLEIPKVVIVEASIVRLYQNEASFEELFDKFRSMGYSYKGNLNQLYSPSDGKILQVDAIFIK